MRKQGWAFAATALLAALVGSVVAVPATPAQALSGSEFSAGYIISDPKFFNYNSMTEAQIQAFLVGKLPATCAEANGVKCMKNFTQDTFSRAASANGNCQAYAGAVAESAARILFKVAQACGINPQVLLVTLQKEQGLVTKTSPTSQNYRAAMGYGCPDSSVCDSKYYGFYNQVYNAAWQFRQYTLFPNRAYKIGNVAIKYHPSTSCAAPVVNIRNQATANLYNYTPYQPNAAALANLTGTGDACSSYGNRNFWRYFSSWFGSPTGPINPFGKIEASSVVPGSLTVTGYAIDGDTTAPITVNVVVDGVTTAVVADVDRPDLATTFSDYGTAHGFTFTVAAPGGAHTVCVTAMNTLYGTANTLLGCPVITVPTGPPVGVIESATVGDDGVTLAGWAFDPDTTAPASVKFVFDGTEQTVVADQEHPTFALTHPDYGSAHAFTLTVPAAPGSHSYCATAINIGGGANASMGCKLASVPYPPGTIPEQGRAPIGALQIVTTAAGSITASGWALDYDTASPVRVHVYVDSKGTALWADQPVAGIDATYPGYGDNHGFLAQIVTTAGSHKVCAFAINSVPGVNTQIGCKTVTVPAAAIPISEQKRAPIGAFETLTVAAGVVTATGWAIDPDTAASIRVHVYFDAAGVALTADVPRTDIATRYPLYGANHGFTASRTLVKGSHKVCAYAINSVAGTNTLLGCKYVTVP